MTTGSQGEPMSGLTRMSNRDHRNITIEPGDTVIVSASPDPRQRGGGRQDHRQPLQGGRDGPLRAARALPRLRPRLARGAQAHAGRWSSRATSSRSTASTACSCSTRCWPRAPASTSTRSSCSRTARWSSSTADARPDGRHACTAGAVLVDGIAAIDGIDGVVLRDRRMLASDGVVMVALTDRRQDRPAGRRGRTSSAAASCPIRTIRSWPRPATTCSTRSASGREDEHAAEAGYVKTKIRDTLSRFFHQRTKRRPMILPIVMEV